MDRHVYFFEEAPNSQQAEERNFLRNVSTVLCADPEQSEDAYLGILHGMLTTVRAAINKHVHAAFWVKATCGELMAICEQSKELQSKYEDLGTDEVCELVESHYALGCMQAVLTHEKHNLAGK